LDSHSSCSRQQTNYNLIKASEFFITTPNKVHQRRGGDKILLSLVNPVAGRNKYVRRVRVCHGDWCEPGGELRDGDAPRGAFSRLLCVNYAKSSHQSVKLKWMDPEWRCRLFFWGTGTHVDGNFLSLSQNFLLHQGWKGGGR